MDYGIRDKVAIVTGAARGLGAETALALAQEGVQVVLVDINQDGLDTRVAKMAEAGFQAHALACDITKADQVQHMVDATISRFGNIHILVNNAGFPRDGFLTKMGEDEWDAVIAVILKGSFLVSKAVMPHLIAQKWGRIINISSRAYLGNPGQANYSAAKAGIIGFTRALSLESGRYDITVNAVAPGFIETEMVQTLDNYEKIKERTIAHTPIQRVGKPADIAHAVTFLASDQASFITGETLHVTGGRYAS